MKTNWLLTKKSFVFDRTRQISNITKFNQKIFINIQQQNNNVIKSCITNGESISIETLLKISAANNTKFKFIKYEREKFAPIAQQCKKLNIKLNGCLNMILVIAHKLLYDKYETSENISKIHYFNSVSLRKYLNKEKDAQKFCYLVANLFKTHEFNSDQKCFDSYLRGFWHDAKIESDNFHKRLNDREYLINWKWSDCKVNHNEMCFDYFCANLGSLPSSSSLVNGQTQIQVLESFDVMNISADSRDGLMSVITSTIDNNLFWSIMFNSHFITDECMNFFCDSIKNIMDHLMLHV